MEGETTTGSNRHGTQATGRQFDINSILNSTAFNISVGIILLLVGIVVTVVTFMEHRSTNKVFLLGPILVGAGVLGIGKAVLKKYRFGDIDQRRRRRRRSRQLHRVMENQENVETGRSISISGGHGSQLQDSLYEPPPYSVVTLVRPESASQPADANHITETMLPKYSEDDPLPPPPKYEDIITGEVNGSYSVDDTTHILEAEEHSEDINPNRLS